METEKEEVWGGGDEYRLITQLTVGHNLMFGGRARKAPRLLFFSHRLRSRRNRSGKHDLGDVSNKERAQIKRGAQNIIRNKRRFLQRQAKEKEKEQEK
ncbi:hypothetical protein CEXT_595831 [Caerostris extrusa]|uniref:Uncharacterized protein n=1 Tax=Caerostris extrusa TaxID=172846 RepID=A0AAV4XZ43_CAEEX|nr:hypothetical protein CEXT_595831 [Caerostris extrusa]